MKEKLPPQIGMSIGADFEEMTWTFEMPSDFKMTAGRFIITPYDTITLTHSQLQQLLKNILKHEREDYTMDGLRVSHIPIIDIQNEFRNLGVTVDDKINF